jgi:hypothetical protein
MRQSVSQNQPTSNYRNVANTKAMPVLFRGNGSVMSGNLQSKFKWRSREAGRRLERALCFFQIGVNDLTVMRARPLP